MKDFFVIQEVDNPEYGLIVYLTKPDSILNYIPMIEMQINRLFDKNVELNILLDTLLYSGNTEERFISCRMINGRILPKSFNFVNISKDSIYRELASEFYVNHKELINTSPILNSLQKKLIIEKIVH